MPRRVNIPWGRLGTVCVQGFGQTDAQLEGRGIVLGEVRGDRGCVLSHAEFSRLAVHFKKLKPLTSRVRRELNFIRGFYLRGRLYEANRPTQAERNRAIAVLADHMTAFRS